MEPGRESQSIFSRIPTHATHEDLSIDRVKGSAPLTVLAKSLQRLGNLSTKLSILPRRP